MAKMIFVLALMVAVASTQPIETIATSGGVSLLTQLINWGQAAFEVLVALVVKAFEPVEPSRDETSKWSCKNPNLHILYYISWLLKEIEKFSYTIEFILSK